MPPIPPPGGMPPPAGEAFFGSSATMASVVISSAATEAAFWIAARTTLVGSMMPFLTRSPYSPVCESKPYAYDLFSRILPTMTEPSSPALIAIWRAGADSAVRHRFSRRVLGRFCCVGALVLELLGSTEQGDAAARNDAFLNRRTGRVHRVINAILALLHFDLGRAADADHRDAACELGQTLLQLLTVVVRGGFLDLRLDLGDTGFDVGLLAGAVDDGGVVLVDHHLLGAAEHLQGHVFELDAEFLRDRLAAGQDRDVLQHGLAAIAEARSLDGRDLQAATQTVDDQGGERFAFDVFSDDDERLAGLHHGFEQRQQFVQRGELLLVDQDVGVVHFNAHLIGVGDEVGRNEIGRASCM